MWIKLYGDNPEGIPAEWPMEVRESGTSPGKDWIEMDKKQYEDYRKLHEHKKNAWNADNPKVDPAIQEIKITEKLREIALRELEPAGSVK
jgi:hypothetical protein